MSISFTLSSEQKALQQLAHDFAKREIRPVAAEYDRSGTWAQKILDSAWDLGLVNYHIPNAYGGLGLKILDGAIIEEELAWGCSGIGTALMANSLGQMPIIIAGSKEQKKQWLTPFQDKNIFCSYAVTEPSGGSDVSAIKTTAKLEKDKYIINGQKAWITGAGHAAWFFVLAKTDNKISAFIIPSNIPGVIIGKKEDNMGQRASDTRTITFENVEIPMINRLGKEGDGFVIAMETFDYTRPMVASSAVGVARAAMEHAIEYSKERHTFGKPIWKHQSIGFMIADMATKIEAARLITWKSAVLKDNNRRNTLYASIAKRFAADAAMEIATDAVQIFGGNGFSREYPVEKIMRDAKILQIYEGTSQIQRLIITREIFSR